MKKKVDLNIYWEGKPKFSVNERLLTSMNAWHNVEAIKQVHDFRLILMSMMRSENDKVMLRELAKDMTECEFELQRLWGFDLNPAFHRFWLLPKCGCPKMDNEDRYGTGFFVINRNCVIHGD